MIKEKVLGERHPSTATSYNNLAELYYSQGNYSVSLSYCYKAYKICISKPGLNHPNTKLVYRNMQATYYKQNPEGDFNQWLEERLKETE